VSDTRYVIIGNGVAGISAAQEIRKVDPDGVVSIIADEPDPYYYRASLSEWISEASTDEMIRARTPAFYDDMGFETIPGSVTGVDPEAKGVSLDDERQIRYDKLLIATGASPNRIPIEGLTGDLAYRTWHDARDIKAHISPTSRVLVLGGGVLGLELAGGLVEIGMHDIAIVQLLDFVGPPLLDQPAGEWLQQRIAADGVTLFLGDTVERVEDSVAHLRSGAEWPFDIFVQSVGVRARYPAIPDLEVGRSIRVDAHCATNLPDVYAAGDCTETYKPALDRWMGTRIWLDCARQGKVAGCSMTGVDASLAEFPFFNASIIYNLNYAYIGDPNVEGGEVHLQTSETAYRKFRVDDGVLAGAVLMGDRRGMMAIHKAIGQPVAAYGDAIVQPDFAWNDLTGQDWDYLFY